MSVFTVHLLRTNIFTSIRNVSSQLKSSSIPGLVHAETMFSMTLGAHILSPKRILFRQLVVFAQWEDEYSINNFLNTDKFGKKLNNGWHIRLLFVRQWGFIDHFKLPKGNEQTILSNDPVVALTIARMRILQVPRFIRWGRPVEKLVRDHPGTTLSLAAMRPYKTVSTFSIWNSLDEMKAMVHGHSNVDLPERHIDAMKERERKDFHTKFTTLRFIPISERGVWMGHSNFIPS